MNPFAGVFPRRSFDRPFPGSSLGNGFDRGKEERHVRETPARDAKLVQLLNEAFTKEKQLETALQAHIELTTRDDYAKRLKDHLTETKSHAAQVSSGSSSSEATRRRFRCRARRARAKAAESVSDVVGKAKAAGGAAARRARNG